LNRKLLAWLLGSLLGLGYAIHLLRGYQVRHHAGVWLRQARTARAEGNLGQCLDYLSRYLAYQSGDVDALVEYGLLLDPLGTTPRAGWQALAVLEQALARHPDRDDIRRHLVRIAMSLGRWTDAQVHLHSLLASSPEDGELEYLRGCCLEGTGDYVQAAAWHEQAVQHAPQQLAAYSRLANLLQNRLDQGPRAREVLDRMMTANDQSYQAYLLRARFRHERGLWMRALTDIDRARQLAPSEPNVLLAAADFARVAGTVEETRADLRKGLEVHPRDSRLYMA